MDDITNIAVALIALLGNFVGFFASNKLLNYRISQLEDTVKERSKSVESVKNMEKDIEYIKKTIERNGGRIDNLENREK